MELDSAFAGTRLKPCHVEISWRQMMNYAAAIQDDNPLYFDDTDVKSLIGHPMLPVAVTWPLLQNLAENLEIRSFPTTVLTTQVHYSECLLLFRPLRVGDRITIHGAIEAILPHRSGTHVVIRMDAADGLERPVFREYTGALLRGVNCKGKGKGFERLPSTPDCPSPGGCLWDKSIFIHPLQTYLYDGCTNIFFPIHTSKKYARHVGLPDIILQGTATLAYAVRELIREEASQQPLRLKKISCQFTHMVLPGTHIHVRLIHSRSLESQKALHFVVLNDRKQEAISNGYAVLENETPSLSARGDMVS